jgi:hypothetical protein
MDEAILKYAPALLRSIGHVRSRTPAPLQTRARQPRPRTLRARRHQSRSVGARLLGETAKRPAGRAETSNPWEMGAFPTMARSGGNRRKLAETPCRNSARGTVRSFAVSPKGCSPSPDWRIACGNCGNCLQKPFEKPTALCVSLSGCTPGFAGGASAAIGMMGARK